MSIRFLASNLAFEVSLKFKFFIRSDWAMTK